MACFQHLTARWRTVTECCGDLSLTDVSTEFFCDTPPDGERFRHLRNATFD